VKVEGTMPGSPADGKFRKGEIITGVNGVAHRGPQSVCLFRRGADPGRGHRRPDGLRRRSGGWRSGAPGNRRHPGARRLQPGLAAQLRKVAPDHQPGRRLFCRPGEVQRGRHSRRAGLPVPAFDRRRRLAAAGEGLLRRLPEGCGQDRRPHLEQRLQRHRLRRILPAHRRRVGAADLAAFLRRRAPAPEIRPRLDPLGRWHQSRLRRRAA
jgi:hypothetical protein